MTLKWFVVHCHPNKEHVAEFNIKQQGFGTYIPCYKKLKRHARRVYPVLAPLFPRYFFVQIDQENSNWLPINYTPGVKYLLKNKEGMLSSVPNNIIEELYRNHDETGLVSLSVLELFKSGDKVRILDGAFINHMAIYEKMTDDQRVELLINLIQQEVKITVPLYAVEKI